MHPMAGGRAQLERWDRLSTVLLLAIVGLVGTAFSLKVAEPYRMGRDMVRTNESLRGQVESLAAENDALEAELRDLNTPRGIEIEARRQHYIRPWEKPVRVTYTRPDGEALRAVDLPESPSDPSR